MRSTITRDRIVTPQLTLDYELERRRRRTFCMQVREDMTVRVLAPLRADIAEIRRLVIARATWIHRKRTEQRCRPPGVSTLPASGSEIPFLGERLTLEVTSGHGPAQRMGRDLVIPATDLDQALAKLKQWYRRETLSAAERNAAQWILLIGRQPARFSVREQKTRWGSCSAHGVISLNWRLLLGPLDLFEYVLVHELCHLLHPNHGPHFWHEMNRLLPDTLTRRSALRVFAGTWFEATAPQ